MKHCAYCGRENDDAAIACCECGTEEFQSTASAGTPRTAQPTPPPPSQLEFVPLNPKDMNKDFVTLTRCRTLLEADMIVAQLDGAGISAFIPDQFLMQTIAFNVNTFGFVRVEVPPKEYEAAKEFLLAAKPHA